MGRHIDFLACYGIVMLAMQWSFTVLWIWAVLKCDADEKVRDEREGERVSSQERDGDGQNVLSLVKVIIEQQRGYWLQ